jgi:cell fate (sporulation/competence/biofilm development) regulator YmcA (YheA/YmcA/DUF963 family)
MQKEVSYYGIAGHFADDTRRSLFLTGKAGTGKTTFLKQLKAQSKKKIAIVAPTGVAAINAGGVTIHSFFQLPLHPFIPTAEGRKNLTGQLKMNASRRKVICELDTIVIDEISMVRADVLDAVDTVLRYVRYGREEPFGGVQIIFIGDMYQLSPVYRDDERQLLAPYYRGMYFFDSHVVQQQPPVYIEFDRIFRQSDSLFIRLLNEVRNNNISNESFSLLQSLYKPDFKPPPDETYITLTTHNYKADSINARELEKLPRDTHRFTAVIHGEYPEKIYPTEETLEFKIGAKVMFLKNDKETPRRYFNGKIGEITSFDEKSITVKCAGEEEIVVTQETWENISYTTNDETKKLEETMLGVFTQYPLRLAWAITIHKSQGLTFDKAIIDAGQAFAPGQVYVALSRCRSLEGLVLLSHINHSSLQVDEHIVEHSSQKLPVDELKLRLDASRREYHEHILHSVFDFKTEMGQTNRLLELVKEKASSFNPETLPFVESIRKTLQEQQTIALRFQGELQRLATAIPVDEMRLQKRIESAVDYFSQQLKKLSDEMKHSPAISDSKANALDYNDDLKMIFSSVEEKLHIFKNIRNGFSVEQYFIAKNTLVLPAFPVNAFAGSAESKKTEARFPALYYRLSELRRNICDASNVPLYMVASTKGLTELATYLPQNLNDILKISGFGEATAKRYGQQFLDVILDYCRKNNLESLMHKKIEEKRERKKDKKNKKDKKDGKNTKDTKKVTFDLYKEGLSIAEIAGRRSLAVSTIEGHLAHYVGKKEIPLRDFMDEEKERGILHALQSGKSMSEVYAAFNGKASYGEIRMVNESYKV